MAPEPEPTGKKSSAQECKGWMSGSTLPEVAIVGAGGMGALFGAILQDGGLKVTLVDTDREHVKAIRKSGLRISGYGGDRVVKIAITVDARDVDRADLVLFQCKADSSKKAARSAIHLVESGAVCVSFQNGLGNEEVIAGEVGADKVLGGLTTMGGLKRGPGEISDFARVPSYVGEMQGGISGRAKALAAVFSSAGLETHSSADITREIWKKLLGNIAMSAVSGVTGLVLTRCLAIPELRETSLRALDEALQVASSAGIQLDRQETLDGLDTITRPGGTGENKSSLCVDLLNGRRTEVDSIYGTVIAFGRKNGIPTPTLDTLVSLVKGMETRLAEA